MVSLLLLIISLVIVVVVDPWVLQELGGREKLVVAFSESVSGSEIATHNTNHVVSGGYER